MGMTPKKLRAVLRTIHLGVALPLGAYFYAPADEVAGLRLVGQVFLIPALVITGLWMWQQRRVSRWLSRGKAGKEG